MDAPLFAAVAVVSLILVNNDMLDNADNNVNCKESSIFEAVSILTKRDVICSMGMDEDCK